MALLRNVNDLPMEGDYQETRDLASGQRFFSAIARNCSYLHNLVVGASQTVAQASGNAARWAPPAKKAPGPPPKKAGAVVKAAPAPPPKKASAEDPQGLLLFHLERRTEPAIDEPSDQRLPTPLPKMMQGHDEGSPLWQRMQLQ
ncbi:unnamed protein product [Symbiodinium sp. CCMP2592]|nr:unnamed protein product [Symbiodinium sp. CCMP2592]